MNNYCTNHSAEYEVLKALEVVGEYCKTCDGCIFYSEKNAICRFADIKMPSDFISLAKMVKEEVDEME